MSRVIANRQYVLKGELHNSPIQTTHCQSVGWYFIIAATARVSCSMYPYTSCTIFA